MAAPGSDAARRDRQVGVELQSISGHHASKLVVQSQALLDAGHPSTLVIPLTTKVVKDAEPLRIHLPPAGKMHKASDLMIDQLRAIDNRRLVKGPLLHLDQARMEKVAEAVHQVHGFEG